MATLSPGAQAACINPVDTCQESDSDDVAIVLNGSDESYELAAGWSITANPTTDPAIAFSTAGAETLTLYIYGTISSADYTAIEAASGTLNLFNNGSISGGLHGLHGVGGATVNVVNTGSISAVSWGVDIAEGQITNSGTISSQINYAIQASLQTVVDNQAAGMITGANGIEAWGNQVTNAGTIDVNGGGVVSHDAGIISNSGTINAGGVGILSYDGGTIANSGTIIAGTTGIDLPDGGFATNAGSITATGGSGISTGFGGYVVNTGTIDAAQGVSLDFGTLENSGTITGTDFAVVGSALSDTVINSGTLDGSVYLGEAPDSYTANLDGGTYLRIGSTEGGDGTDEFIVNTTEVQSFTFDEGYIYGFENLTLNADGANAQLTFNGSVGDASYVFLPGSGTVINTATFHVVDLQDGFYLADGSKLDNRGVINGGVHSAGAGAITIINSGTIFGGTTVSAGVLTNSGIINNGTGFYGQSFTNSGTVNGYVTIGTGVFANSGTVNGTLYIEGGAVENSGVIVADIWGSFDDDTLVNSGLIQGNLDLTEGNDSLTLLSGSAIDGDVAGGDGVDTLNITGSVAEDSAFTGFEVVGTNGAVVFSNATSTFGTLTIAGGSLIFDGTADSALVESGAALGGNGTYGALVVNGALMPGSSPGTITVNGNYTQTATGALLIEIGGTMAGTEYDQLIVNGTATLEAGATIQFTMLDLGGGGQPFQPGNGDVFNFLVADDLVLAAGTTLDDYLVFDGVPSSLNFEYGLIQGGGVTVLQLVASYNIDAGFLAGLGPQAQAIGGYVNQVLSGGLGTTATENALVSLLSLPDGQLVQALSDASPEAYGALSLSSVSQALVIADSVGDRLARWRDGGRRRGLAAWVAGLGAFSTRDADAVTGTSGSSTDIYGVIAGFDVNLSDDILVGALLGRAGQKQHFDNLGATNDSDNVFVGGYAAYDSGGLGIGALVYHGFGDTETERLIAAVDESARGEGDLDHTVASLDLSYRLGTANGWSATPFLRATYVDVSRGAVAETGSDGLAYEVADSGADFLLLDMAIRLSGSFETGGGTRVVPELSFGYRQNLLESEARIAARFIGASGVPFTSMATGYGKGRAIIGAGLTTRLASGIDVFAHYDGELGGDGNDHRLTAGLQLVF